MGRILELDGVRAIAILAVIGCHYYPFTTMLGGWPESGWIGVELFFVLSGFLITGILLNLKETRHPYRVFYARRILRIFPPYYAVFAIVSLIALADHEPLGWTRFVGKILFLQSFNRSPMIFATILHTIRQSLHGHVRLPSPFGISILSKSLISFDAPNFNATFGPAWSLSVEEWFYILWAPLVLLLPRRSLRFTCVSVCIAAMLIRWLGFQGPANYFDYFSRIDALMCGALLALYFEWRRGIAADAQRRGDNALIFSAALAAVALGVILWLQRPVAGRDIHDSMLFMVFGLPILDVVFAGFLSILIRNAGTDTVLCRIFRLRPLVKIGAVSYTLYLIHVPVYFLVQRLGAHTSFIQPQSYSGALCLALVSLAASISIAALSFKYFESPILAYKDQLTRTFTGSSEPVSAPRSIATSSA